MATQCIFLDPMNNVQRFQYKTDYPGSTPSTNVLRTTEDIDGNADEAFIFAAGAVKYIPMPYVPVSGTTWLVFSFFWRRSVQLDTGPDSGYICGPNEVYGSPGNTGTTDAFLYYSRTEGFQVHQNTGANVNVGVFAQDDTWYHIEYAHRFGNATTGNWTLYINGNEVGSGVGDNDGETWNWVNFAGFGSGTGNTGYTYTSFDDMVILVSDDAVAPRTGMLRVKSLAPTGTSQGQWTGSDADSVDNHLLVDDQDKDSADYIESTAGDNEVDLYSHDALPAGATPIAVQMMAAASLDSVGTDDFSTVIDSGGTQDAVAHTLGDGTPAWFTHPPIMDDPNTGTAWTKAGVDAMTFGVSS